MKVQLVDLQKQYQTIKTEIDRAVSGVLEKADFVQGDHVRQFEKEFSAYFMKKGAPPLECASCANGTDALCLALKAIGVSAGDEVITVSHTFIATAEAISSVGATPVFVEIDEKTFLMDPKAIVPAITSRTRAIIVVHVYGQACNMDAICKIAREHRIEIIEDCAQAHGATWNGIPVGSFGIAACFSFYPGKNLGAYGDAGAVVSKNPDVIKKIRLIANHGRVDKYEHLEIGVNSRLDTLQAAILRVKLSHLDHWNDLRIQHAENYTEKLKDLDLIVPFVHPMSKSVWHLYVIQVEQRDEVLKTLKEKGVMAGVHYPIPLHLQPAYSHLGYQRGDLPITEKAAGSILSLPLYPELSQEEIHFVIHQVEESLSGILSIKQY